MIEKMISRGFAPGVEVVGGGDGNISRDGRGGDVLWRDASVDVASLPANNRRRAYVESPT